MSSLDIPAVTTTNILKNTKAINKLKLRMNFTNNFPTFFKIDITSLLAMISVTGWSSM